MATILAAIDFSAVTDDVISQATSLAGAFGAQLVLLHVAAPEPDFVGYEPGPKEVRETRAAELRDEHRHIQALAQRAREGGVDAKALLLQGPTVETIVSEAQRLDANTIVIGSHGRGALHRALLGSATEGVVRASHTPVLIVPAARDTASSTRAKE